VNRMPPFFTHGTLRFILMRVSFTCRSMQCATNGHYVRTCVSGLRSSRHRRQWEGSEYESEQVLWHGTGASPAANLSPRPLSNLQGVARRTNGPNLGYGAHRPSNRRLTRLGQFDRPLIWCTWYDKGAQGGASRRSSWGPSTHRACVRDHWVVPAAHMCRQAARHRHVIEEQLN